MSLDREFLPAAELVKLGASIVPYDRTLNFDDVRGEIYQPRVSALGSEDYTLLDFGGIVAVFPQQC